MPENENTSTGDQQDAAAQEATEDVEAQQDAVQETDDDSDDSTLDPKAKTALEKVRREAANLRKRLKDLEPAARRLRELEDKDKTENQKLTEQLAELQTKILEHEVREVRVAAATAAGLPASMAQFITASDPDEAKAQAKALAEFGKGGQGADFKQGARQNSGQKATGDDWLRRMAGRK